MLSNQKPQPKEKMFKFRYKSVDIWAKCTKKTKYSDIKQQGEQH